MVCACTTESWEIISKYKIVKCENIDAPQLVETRTEQMSDTQQHPIWSDFEPRILLT